MNSPKKKLTGVITYILTISIALELLSRLILGSPFGRDLMWRLALSGARCDSSSRIIWIYQHSSIRKNSRYNPNYKYIVHNASRGYAIKPGLTDAAYFGDKTLSANSRGLRGKIEYQYAKPPEKKRIVVLGDSFTFGEEVSDEETYPYYLQQLLPLSEVINFGVTGYAHDQMLIYLKEEGIKYGPDIVILGFTDCDINRNILAFRDYAKPRFFLHNGKMVLKGCPIPSPEDIIKEEPYRSKFLDLVNIAYQSLRWKSGLNQKEAKDITAAILDEMVKTIKSAGAIPLFVHLPTGTDISDPREKKFLFNYCEARGILYLSIHPYFYSRIQKGANLKTDNHWSSQEHRIAAEAIKAYLIKKGIF